MAQDLISPETRRPFGGAPPQDEGVFDWRNLAGAAAGLGGLAAIIGSARFGGPGGQNAKLYREFIRNVTKNAAPAVETERGGEWVKRLLGGSWWHGTPHTDAVLARGFDPTREKMGLRFGEPFGISVSASPRTAASFGVDGRNVLRVWPRVDPKSVLPVWADEAHEPLARSYLAALEAMHNDKTIRQHLQQLNSGGWGVGYATREMPGQFPEATRLFNKVLSQDLEKQGIQGLLYNPHRYGEHELRVLDPRRAVPIESREIPFIDKQVPAEYDAAKRLAPMHRFADRKHVARNLPYAGSISWSWNRSLSEHYKNISEEQVLGATMAPVKMAPVKQSVDDVYNQLMSKPVHPKYQVEQPDKAVLGGVFNQTDVDIMGDLIKKYPPHSFAEFSGATDYWSKIEDALWSAGHKSVWDKTQKLSAVELGKLFHGLAF